MQETKFDAMTSMFREMMQYQRNSPPTDTHIDKQLQELPVAPPKEQETFANKRTATEDLEQVHEADERMDIDSELPSNSRKRNNQSASPAKENTQLFPLFRHDGRDQEVSRKLFGGHQKEATSPTNVLLPPSPVREASTPALLTEAEDAQQSISSGNESKQSTQMESQVGDQSTTASSC